ncbi:MAG: hypothetical protein L3J13_06385, partial [Devosiaceae bacterium]|nr:hypothetical protein [Devosiaceae bacterium]
NSLGFPLWLVQPICFKLCHKQPFNRTFCHIITERSQDCPLSKSAIATGNAKSWIQTPYFLDTQFHHHNTPFGTMAFSRNRGEKTPPGQISIAHKTSDSSTGIKEF